jgi:hypothetical protein
MEEVGNFFLKKMSEMCHMSFKEDIKCILNAGQPLSVQVIFHTSFRLGKRHHGFDEEI